MHVFRENIDRVSAFYNSDYYRTLKADTPAYIRSVCKGLMEDPDACDRDLYKEKAIQLGIKEFCAFRTSIKDDDTVLGMDCVIGWKKLFDIHKGSIEWLRDYKEIRSNLNSHILWPRSEKNTINTVRARAFNDRIDYTLYDISLFFDRLKSGERIDDLKLAGAYYNPVTYNWLSKHKCFGHLVERLHLQCFCSDQMGILNLSDGHSVIQGYMPDYKTVDAKYLQNLKAAIRASE